MTNNDITIQNQTDNDLSYELKENRLIIKQTTETEQKPKRKSFFLKQIALALIGSIYFIATFTYVSQFNNPIPQVIGSYAIGAGLNLIILAMVATYALHKIADSDNKD